AWSPDGRGLVITADRQVGGSVDSPIMRRGIYRVGLTSSPVRLWQAPRGDSVQVLDPSWAPDDPNVAFIVQTPIPRADQTPHGGDAPRSIMFMNFDGSE